MAYMDTMTGLETERHFWRKTRVMLFSGNDFLHNDGCQISEEDNATAWDITKGDELIITIAKCMRAAVGQNGQVLQNRR